MLSHPFFPSKCHFFAPKGSCFSSNSAVCLSKYALFTYFSCFVPYLSRPFSLPRPFSPPVMPRLLFTFSAFNTHYLRIYYYAFISFWHIQKKYSPFFSPFVSDSAVILPFYCTFFLPKPHFCSKKSVLYGVSPGLYSIYTAFIADL